MNNVLGTKTVTVLYVCPYAHYGGHYSRAALVETKSLADAGINTTLLTFCGFIDGTETVVPHMTVISRMGITFPIYRIIGLARRWAFSRWFAKFIEAAWTISVAINLKKRNRFDIIQLRDGEPYPFLPHLLCFPFHGICWLISLIGSNIDILPIKSKESIFRMTIIAIGKRLTNSSIFRPLYSESLKRNNFIFYTQNEVVKQKYNSFLDGVFNGKVVYLPLGMPCPEYTITKEIARKHLGLPLDKHILLSFGAPHPGKDLEIIFRAISDIPSAILVQAGCRSDQLLEHSPEKLANKYDKLGNVIIKDGFIPESEKPYYYCSADGVILSYKRDRISSASLLWEACSWGVPCLASDDGQLGDLMTEFRPGLIFSAQDAESLHEAILQFISANQETIRQYEGNCKRFCAEFSMQKWAERCSALFKELTSS